MKELLYIPGGTYCRFKLNNDLVSYEEYINVYYICDIRNFVEALNRSHAGWDDFIKRNYLPKELMPSQFEIVER